MKKIPLRVSRRRRETRHAIFILPIAGRKRDTVPILCFFLRKKGGGGEEEVRRERVFSVNNSFNAIFHTREQNKRKKKRERERDGN